MMDLDKAIQHCEKVAEKQDKLCEISVTERAKEQNSKCADEHRQLAEWLKELKAYRDARAEINQALYDDARGEQNDYERGRKSGIFLCESIISVKLGESRSEIPNICGDTISRQEALNAITMAEVRWQAVDNVNKLPSVSPQQRTGRWILHPNGIYAHLVCDKCLSCAPYDCKTNYCPNCGAKMEVEDAD